VVLHLDYDIVVHCQSCRLFDSGKNGFSNRERRRFSKTDQNQIRRIKRRIDCSFLQSKYFKSLECSSMTRFLFQDSNFSTYQRMWSFMESARPSVFTSSNVEGVDRVVKGKGSYAFLMESTSIEYVIERNCELTQVGGMLDSKGYGIAMPPSTIIDICIICFWFRGTKRIYGKRFRLAVQNGD
jgi:hypothetical protein